MRGLLAVALAAIACSRPATAPDAGEPEPMSSEPAAPVSERETIDEGARRPHTCCSPTPCPYCDTANALLKNTSCVDCGLCDTCTPSGCGTIQDCSPYNCNGTGTTCNTSCATDSQCSAADYCCL